MIRPAAEIPVSHQQLLGALRDPIQPVRVGISYRLGLVLVAAVMLILPVVYLAIIAAVAYALYWHAVHDASILSGRGGGRAKLAAYAAPLVIGGILLLFMIKPLFARRVRKTFPLSLSRKEEPTLFAFVERLCEVVGAPKPRRIDVDTAVNASASFGDGMISFLRRDLVLTIGLPLVAGLSLRQLTGVLAHEFGHFAQGNGMRLTYLIRRINGWFARVVYERDSWDEWLTEASQNSENGIVALVVALARLFVWITRRILWLLMWAGHAVSAFMLRQMEFDADRYEARVAGSHTFVETAEKLVALDAAAHAAFSDLSVAWQEGRLCDDLPSLIRWRESDMPHDVRLTITKHTRAMKTGWFDSHPCDADRIASARREATAGIFQLDAPARALFSDFEELSRRATVAFYHQQLEGMVKPQNLIPTESLVADRGRKKESYAAMRRYFQDLLHPMRPVFPERIVTRIVDQSGAAEMLLDLRSQFSAAVADAQAAALTFNKADAQLVSIARVRALKNACVKKIDAKQFDLPGIADEQLVELRRRASTARASSLETLNNVLTIGMQRLELALSIDGPVGPQRAAPSADAEDRGEYDLARESAPGSQERLSDALRCLSANSAVVEEVRQQFQVLAALLAHCKPDGNPQELIGAAISAARKLHGALGRLQQGLAGSAYPYEHVAKQVTLASFALPQIPQPELVPDVLAAADAVLGKLYALYVRIMSDLALHAEQVEQSLGLVPLPEPAEEKCE